LIGAIAIPLKLFTPKISVLSTSISSASAANAVDTPFLPLAGALLKYTRVSR
jgi:hypothetical protein